MKTVQSRLEDYACEAGFDTVVTRAVVAIAPTWVSVSPLLRAGGCFLGMKGQNPLAECHGLTSAHWRIEPVTVPELTASRHVVVIDAVEGCKE